MSLQKFGKARVVKFAQDRSGLAAKINGSRVALSELAEGQCWTMVVEATVLPGWFGAASFFSASLLLSASSFLMVTSSLSGGKGLFTSLRKGGKDPGRTAGGVVEFERH